MQKPSWKVQKLQPAASEAAAAADLMDAPTPEESNEDAPAAVSTPNIVPKQAKVAALQEDAEPLSELEFVMHKNEKLIRDKCLHTRNRRSKASDRHYCV